MNDKIRYSQFYTVSSPFKLTPFMEWLNLALEEYPDAKILEPFAGSGNIKYLLNSIGIDNDFAMYDIAPKNSEVQKRDTIADFPDGYHICITNPPYMDKSKAGLLGIQYPNTSLPNIYMLCIALALSKCEYGAFIIPQSFIATPYLKDRLYSVIRISEPLFNDTETAVCLALYTPQNTNDFFLYQDNELLGSYIGLASHDLPNVDITRWHCNDPDGNIGVNLNDARLTNARFCLGEEIEYTGASNKRRTKIRVSGLPDGIDRRIFIAECNRLLNNWREETKDIFLGCYRCLKNDGTARHHLTHRNVKTIMELALASVTHADAPKTASGIKKV